MLRHGLRLLLLLLGYAPLRADDTQLQAVANVTFLERAAWRAWLYAEGRLSDDEPAVPLLIVAPRMQYQFHPLFSLGLGVGRGESAPPATGADRQGFWRSELEQQSRLALGGTGELRLRNRWEHAWRDDGGETDRSRHRLELYVRAPADWRPLHGFFLQDEFFYGWTAGRWQENRVVPFGLEWRLAGKSRLRTAYQWQLFNRAGGRHVSHVLGLQLDVPLN